MNIKKLDELITQGEFVTVAKDPRTKEQVYIRQVIKFLEDLKRNVERGLPL